LRTLLILLTAALLRFSGAAWNVRFHPDEAWFATFARNAAVHGAWMLPGALDKTPLAIYAQALSMHLFAVESTPAGILDLDIYRGEWAARLPSALAGIVTVAAIIALGRRLGGRRAGDLAGLIAASSPYGIAYSASAFTDGLMAMFIAVGLAAARPTLRGGTWAGVFIGLAFACKQQGLYAVPFCIALLAARRSGLHRRLIAFALALAGVIGVVLIWDAARSAETGWASVFAQAAANNDPERFFPAPDELIPRLSAWLTFAPYLFAASPIWIALILLARPRLARLESALLLLILGYLVVHWLVRFNLYDRYLLPLLPMAAALVGVMLARARRPIIIAFAALLIVGGTAAYRGGIPIGAEAAAQRDDGRSYAGIDQIAAWLDSRTLGAIIYDRWLGWSLDYYLGAWSDKRRVYYPTPDELAVGAAAQPDPAPRYFVAPTDVEAAPYLSALESAGFRGRSAFAQGDFVVYELIRETP
jgi:4-amino-4-deoxy-L-arabinose transferase-like glycosyltransferase